jgi:hypothetical protein
MVASGIVGRVDDDSLIEKLFKSVTKIDKVELFQK